jgi:hypothetical protein
MPFASHNTRIAIAASPAPRKIALIMNSMTIDTLPPSIHACVVFPVRDDVGRCAHDAQQRWRERDADDAEHDRIDRRRAGLLARRLSPRPRDLSPPMRRATTADPEIAKPIAIA